ncbi:hypothetical protein [uncultured Polaribacter sp.]|uniref:hypothetical protein n=1 Tax=uncultured Polaribacter sp. TaxID=174711 RepID=UPI002613FB74|nr:hypothetical protein [uncultured Polaribacter sp.]
MDFRRITRVKNITDKLHEKDKREAYFGKNVGDKFKLHYPDKYRGNILKTNKGDYIVLYQTMGINNEKYVTHLVRTIDNKEAPEEKKPNYKYGRMVELIAFVKKEIPYKETLFKNLNFTNKGWGYAASFENEKFVPQDKLEKLQKHLVEIFKPYMVK